MDIWGNFTQGIPQYAIEAYSAVDPWFYPILFVGIIGYIYAAMNSITSAVIAIIITMGIFATTTSIFADMNELTSLLYIIALIVIAI